VRAWNGLRWDLCAGTGWVGSKRMLIDRFAGCDGTLTAGSDRLLRPLPWSAFSVAVIAHLLRGPLLCMAALNTMVCTTARAAARAEKALGSLSSPDLLSDRHGGLCQTELGRLPQLPASRCEPLRVFPSALLRHPWTLLCFARFFSRRRAGAAGFGLRGRCCAGALALGFLLRSQRGAPPRPPSVWARLRLGGSPWRRRTPRLSRGHTGPPARAAGVGPGPRCRFAAISTASSLVT